VVEGKDETVASDSTVDDGTRSLESARPLGRGDLVGRYVVLGVLGAGGMGIVYGAYDPELDRKVALKLLHAHRARDERATDAHSRLIREAQAMAKLSHPNVITVHDVGSLGDRVYIAMEFVEGQTLGEWTKGSEPGWREVLDMFTLAGQGLAAAHRKGLVHRDFKPDNVLVASDGRVRVMDFGLARPEGHRDGMVAEETVDPIILDRRDSGPTPVTKTGAVMGTPAYMAPEQHLGLATDARTDQFSFCVALYEALYCERPFAGNNVGVLAFQVTQGKVQDAPRGSKVPGWLRCALLQGLATTPDDRFGSMDELLGALGRGQVRGRTGRALAALGVVAVLGAGAEGYRRYDVAQRWAACEALADEVTTAWNEDRRQRLHQGLVATNASYAAATAENVMLWLDRQAEAWQEARVETCLDANVRGVWDADTLDRSLWCLDERRVELSSLVDELSRADETVVQKAVAAAAGLSSVAPCRDESALAMLSPPPTENREQVQKVRQEVTRAANLKVAGRYDEGLEVARAALERAEALSWPPLVAAARLRAGQLLEKMGEYAEAETALEDAYFEAATCEANEIMVEAAERLVYLVGYRSARPAEGKRWARLAEVALASAQDREGLRRAGLLGSRAAIHYGAADLTQAKALHERALAIREEALGPDHPDVASSLNNLGAALQMAGNHEEAKALYERALAIREKTLGLDHPHVAVSLYNLGAVLHAIGDHERARAWYERSLAIYERALAPDHPDLASPLHNLANAHRQAGNPAQARALHERALAIREKTLGTEHPEVAYSLNNLADLHREAGNHARATELYERTLAIFEKVEGPEHALVAYPVQGLAQVALAQGRSADAVQLAERAVAVREKGNATPDLMADARFVLAQALWKAPRAKGRDRARALTLANQARDAYRGIKGDENDLAEANAWLTEHGDARAE
jgi:tetratricopeptide (TPR) repeat protein/tRNA A-37 threonylcarbamoyl transferase component Bud32